MLTDGLPNTAPAPTMAPGPGGRCLYDLPNEILLKILGVLPCTALLPLGLTSTRLHDLARRVLRGHLLAAVGRADLRIILESYHPCAQWTEPYLYCTYLDTPGLGLEDVFASSAYSGSPSPPPLSPSLSGDSFASPPLSPPPLELICPDGNAPPLCSASSLAALMRNVYSRFLPLVPGAMTVTETRHPAGGRMPVRKGNIARAATISVPSTSASAQPDGPSGLSASAPTSSAAFPSSSAASADPTGAALAALQNASMLEDRLRTTNPTSGPDNHAFTNGVELRRQAEAANARVAAAQRRGGFNVGAEGGSSSYSTGDNRSGGLKFATSPKSADLEHEQHESEHEPTEAERLVSHRIRMDADEPFWQLLVQTSLIGEGPQPGVFGRLLPVNDRGVVRVKREWLEERAAADEQRGHHDDDSEDLGRGEDTMADQVARTLWVDHGRDVGLRVRVKQLHTDALEEDGGGRRAGVGDEVCFEVLYEELLIRTAHLEAVLARARRGELAGRANQAIVFGTGLSRGWVRG